MSKVDLAPPRAALPFGASSLQAVSLRATATPANGSETLSQSLPHLQESHDAGDDDATREYFFQSGIDKWYSHLQSYTFESAVVDFGRAEAQAIVDYYEDSRFFNSDSIVVPIELEGLLQRLQNCMNAKSSKSSRYFVKLSTRSPKDSSVAFQKAVTEYHRRVGSSSALEDHQRWAILTEEMGRATSVDNARDALLLCLSSERVAEDLKFGLENINWLGTSLVVRDWDDRITLKSEFRGFCWGENLNCLGQYYHPLYFEELNSSEVQNQICNDCLALFNDIKSNHGLPIQNALVDFAWLGPGEVLLIEINPLSDTLGCFPASTGLFDYVNDMDIIKREIEGDVEIRVRSAPESTYNLKLKSRPEWRNLIYDSSNK